VAQDQVVTITFFKYSTIRNQWWALKQMRKARSAVESIPSNSFFKLLGSGSGNGFSIWPDFSVYAILCVWDSYHDAKNAITNSPVYLHMKSRSDHQLDVFMHATKAKGTWNQQQPFSTKTERPNGDPIAVITRASIARNKLLSFWKRVPSVSRRLQQISGLVFSKGVGELPLLEQATFSIWENRESMVNYAYKGQKHRDIIKKTHQYNWYTEELFAEFRIIGVNHDWPGLDTSLIGKFSSPEKNQFVES